MFNTLKKNFQLIYPLFFLIFSLGSCVNSGMMLKTPRDFQYSALPVPSSPEYKIAPNDIIEISLYSNDGFQIINPVGNFGGNTTTQSGNGTTNFRSFDVEFDGTVRLPVIGRVALSGMTQRQAELFLEEKYSEYFIKPFVILNISNRRVFVFSGEPGKAQVVELKYNSTSLFEVLASIGGLSQNAKANKIKLIRGNLENPEIYLFDVSTIDNAKNANIILQANDIIYIESRHIVVKGILVEMAPYLSLISTALLVFTLSKNFTK